MTYPGPVSWQEMKATVETEDQSKVPDVVLVICDLREAGKSDAEARKVGARSPKPAKRYFTAYLGADFTMRVVIDMWNRATNLIHGHKYSAEFCDDHESAHAWLLPQREAYRKGLA